MILKLSRRIRAHRQDDDGIAMIMVMGSIMVLTVLLGVTLAYAIQAEPEARHDQDWNAALSAAQSGVDDYIARLNQNDSYWNSVDCSNIALKGPNTGTNGCGWSNGTAPGWQLVDPGNAKGASYHYDVDPSGLASKNTIQVDSTGRVRGVDRTVQVLVSRGGPTSFLYYTDFEDADPANQFAYPSGAPNNTCGLAGPTSAKYWFDTTGTTRSSAGCVEITFASGDVINGRAHFNDTPLSQTGAVFKQGFETSDPKCSTTPYSINNCVRTTGGTPTVTSPYKATFAPHLDLADNSDQFANYPGCVYTGDTRIRFNSDGTMTVWNTGSSATTVTGPGTPGGTNCGVAANFKPATGAAYPASGQTVPVPSGMVIYVKNSSTTSTCVPGQVVNGTTSGSTSGDVIPPGSGTTVYDNTDISYFDPDKVVTPTVQTFTKTSGGWSSGAQTVTNTPTGDDHPSTFNCGQGNVYVEGTVKGQVTIAAQNNVIVTNDLMLTTTTPPTDGSGNIKDASGSDMIGLVSSNSVIVYHPASRSVSSGTTVAGTNCSSTVGNHPTDNPSTGTVRTCTWTETDTYGSTYSDISYPGSTSSTTGRAIYASIQTLQHSFWVDNYKYGVMAGKLTVRGSIAQKWRGIVGQGGSSGTGFLKDYGYDTRLVYTGPPYFPQWTNSKWGAKTTGELKPQY